MPDRSQRARSRQLRGIVTWARGLILLGLALVPALALYTLTAPWPDTPDGLFHLHRTRARAVQVEEAVRGVGPGGGQRVQGQRGHQGQAQQNQPARPGDDAAKLPAPCSL